MIIFFFIHYSHKTNLDNSKIMETPSPVCTPLDHEGDLKSGSHLQSSLVAPHFFLLQVCSVSFCYTSGEQERKSQGKIALVSHKATVTLGCFTNSTILQVVTNSLSPLSG